MTDEYVSVTTTIDSADGAERIAAAVLTPHLAACVQIDGPIKSRYWAEGTIASTDEWRCTIKTRASRLADLERAILAVHPYRVPQILAVTVSSGNDDYLDWIDDSTEATA